MYVDETSERSLIALPTRLETGWSFISDITNKESDSQIAINSITRRCRAPELMRNLVEDIRNLAFC